MHLMVIRLVLMFTTLVYLTYIHVCARIPMKEYIVLFNVHVLVQ